MKLINRYVSEVGKRLLVLKGREDIENELRSTLEDMLEDRAQKEGRAVDEAMEIELLKEYGSPDTVAAIYNPNPHLIGPRIFPFFLRILKIVIFGITVSFIVTTGLDLATQTPLLGDDVVKIIGHGLSEIISTAMAGFGYLVVAFAIIERVAPDLAIKEVQDWDPRELAKEPDADSVKRGELITEIVFTFIALALLNNKEFYTAIFSSTFIKFIPWINVYLIVEIALDLYLLRKALWTPLTRLTKVFIESASLVITFMIYQTPNIFIFTTKYFPNSELPAELNYFFTNLFPLILILVMVIQSIDLIKAILGFFRISFSDGLRINNKTSK